MIQFFEVEEEAQKKAAEKVTPEQASLKAGDFFVRHAYGIKIFSEILDPTTAILGSRQLNDLDEEELRDYKESCAFYETSNYRFTRSYSEACPWGELGDVHISCVERQISREDFLKAKLNNWD